MSAIMRGTTSTIEMPVNAEDFSLTSVTAVEFRIKNGGMTTVYHAEDLIVDTDTNTVTRHLTEGETLKFDSSFPVIAQMRCWLSDGSVVGTKKQVVEVLDIIPSEGEL